jgi:hypothetical protein
MATGSQERASVAGGLTPGDINYQPTKMTLLGHMRKRLKSLVESKFAVHHRRDPALLDETIHVLEIFARANLDAHDICVKTGKRQKVPASRRSQ